MYGVIANGSRQQKSKQNEKRREKEKYMWWIWILTRFRYSNFCMKQVCVCICECIFTIFECVFIEECGFLGGLNVCFCLVSRMCDECMF